MNQHIINAIQPLANKLSRRNALIWLGGSGLTSAFVVGSSNMARADKTPKIVQEWLDAQNSNNPAKVAELYIDNGVLEDVPNQFKVQGQQNIQCFVQSVQKNLINIKLEVLNAFIGQNQATVEYVFFATNNGLIPVPSTIGRSFSVRTTTVFDLQGNKIQRSSDYYDRTAILVQLGLIQAPPASTPNLCS
ncbi:hypothetical protein NIES2101_34720 [Calothrix sp. HK-06]|nr:hypothetical protein NIES2101_34720 [Calothrix sp. HK-06]